MKAQEKSYREDLSHLNQALYVLQQQVMYLVSCIMYHLRANMRLRLILNFE